MVRGWTVAGTGRSPEARAAMAALGVEPVDPAEADPVAQAAARADAILIAAPPSSEGCPGLAALAPTLARRRPAWLGYLSTTGVYGDRGGGWVFEDSPLHARSLEGARRARAEADWLDHGATLFRLPGIYGPGRSAFDRLRAGTAKRLVKPGQVFSRIHVDDLAGGLEASMARPRAGGVYNLCDDEPAPADAVTAFAAGLLGMEPPPEEPFDAARLSPAAMRFWGENKRVSNARAKAELGWRPAYPTYREGLKAVLEAEGSG
ncbi:MAG TPA: SDR family oxidoreductase [Caulobacteraceae bacterium]|jgi:nucleoside-diphosphate-sugar epimerase|nr:SDR family oxidoreductase [Caulobacteraceae bacterium]